MTLFNVSFKNGTTHLISAADMAGAKAFAKFEEKFSRTKLKAIEQIEEVKDNKKIAYTLDFTDDTYTHFTADNNASAILSAHFEAGISGKEIKFLHADLEADTDEDACVMHWDDNKGYAVTVEVMRAEHEKMQRSATYGKEEFPPSPVYTLELNSAEVQTIIYALYGGAEPYKTVNNVDLAGNIAKQIIPQALQHI